MLICGNVRAVPVVSVNELLLALTLDRPVTVPVAEDSATLLAPIVMPEVPPTTATAKLPPLAKLKAPPENPAARLLSLFYVCGRGASPVPMDRNDGALTAPFWGFAPPADTVSVSPLE